MLGRKKAPNSGAMLNLTHNEPVILLITVQNYHCIDRFLNFLDMSDYLKIAKDSITAASTKMKVQ